MGRMTEAQWKRALAKAREEITAEVKAELRAEVVDEVCAMRNRAFSRTPTSEHEFIPVRDGQNRLIERCCVCSQTREVVLPHDQHERMAYIDRVIDDQLFQSRYAALRRQHASEQNVGLAQGWLGATGPVGITGAQGATGPFHTVGGNVWAGPPGADLSALTRIAGASAVLGVSTAQVAAAMDGLVLNGKSLGDSIKAIHHHQAINGQKPTMVIVDEASYLNLADEAKDRMTVVNGRFPSDGLDQILGIPVVKGDVSSLMRGVVPD